MSKKKSKSSRIAIVVLGMHRSGTSALAGVLNILGCDKPATVMDPNPFNELGYFESKRIYPLHSELLASAASRWDDWQPINPGWFDSPRAEEFHDRAVETMQNEFGTSRLFVLKDPRISRLVPFWRGVLADIGVSPRFVLTLRNPLEVAASLAKRDNINSELSMLIWLQHMLQAEYDTRDQKRCFTGFAQLMDNWAGVAETIQTKLDVALPRMSMGVVGEVEAFLRDGLRHHNQDPQKLLANPLISSWVRDTYEVFLRWVQTGEDKADFATLDRIRTTFEETAPSFARLVQASRDDARAAREANSEVARLTEEAATLKSASSEAGNRAEEAAKTAERLKSELAEKNTALESLQEREAALRSESETGKTEIDRLKGETARLNDAVRQARGKADTLDKTVADLNATLAEKNTALESLQEREAALRSESETGKTEIDRLKGETARLNDAVRQARGKADTLDKTVAELNATLTEKNAKINDLQEREAALRTAAETGKTEIDRLKGETARLNDAVRQARGKADTLDKTVAELNATLTEKNAKINDLQTQESELRARLAQNETALIRHNQSAEEARHQMSRLRDDLSEKTSLLADLETRHAREAARASELDAQVRALHDSKQAMSLQHTEEMRLKTAELTAAQEDLRTTEARLKGELAQQVDRLRDLENALSQTQSALAQRSHEADEMRHKSAESERLLEEKTAELETLRTTLQDTEERLCGELKTLRRQTEDHEALMSAKLQRKSEQVSSLEENLKARCRELADMTRILATKETALETERSTSEEALNRERKTREAAESKLNQLEKLHIEDRTRNAQLISERDQKIADLDKYLRTNTREIADVTRLLSDSEHALKVERARLEEMRLSAERAEYAILELQSSSSWRLTAPFRAISKRLRRKS